VAGARRRPSARFAAPVDLSLEELALTIGPADVLNPCTSLPRVLRQAHDCPLV